MPQATSHGVQMLVDDVGNVATKLVALELERAGLIDTTNCTWQHPGKHLIQLSNKQMAIRRISHAKAIQSCESGAMSRDSLFQDTKRKMSYAKMSSGCWQTHDIVYQNKVCLAFSTE